MSHAAAVRLTVLKVIALGIVLEYRMLEPIARDQDNKHMQGCGEEAYDPGADQVVVLLKVTIDGTPALGADTVEIDLSDDGNLRLLGDWRYVEA